MPPFLHNGVTAHRGNADEFPENTLPAFQSALDLGADWLELDVHLSRDGQLVVCHDDTTGRTGDRDLVTADCAVKKLRGVDMAAAFRAAHGLDATACPPAQMPLLREVLELAVKQRRTRVSIQPKADCVEETAELIRELGAQEWIGFNNGDVSKLMSARAAFPGAHVFLDTSPGDTDVERHIGIAREGPFDSLVVHHSCATAERVAVIAMAGLEPGAWTVNEESAMREMLDAGVRRLYTDCPRRMMRLVAAPPKGHR